MLTSKLVRQCLIEHVRLRNCYLSIDRLHFFCYDYSSYSDNLKAKLAELRKETKTLRKDIKSETLQRIDAENKLLTVQEEIQFRDSLHKEVRMQKLKKQQIYT